jgi:hypothetical protein
VNARMVQVERGLAQVWDGDDYLGLLRQHKGGFRTHGTRVDPDDGHLKDMEAEFRTRDEAIAWLFDEPGTES